MKRKLSPLLVVLLLLGGICHAAKEAPIRPPRLTNSPRLDVIVTNQRPLLSVFNAGGGSGPLTYIFQLDTTPEFNSPDLRTYSVPETPRVTSLRIPEGAELNDLTRYFWRVKAVDSQGNESAWGTEAGGIVARFWVDTTSDKQAAGLIRTPIAQIISSGGCGESNLLDQGDQADQTYWTGQPDLDEHLLELDLGEQRTIHRIWMLASPDELSGRPQDYLWECSNDRQNWHPIAGATVTNADAFRTIIDLAPPVTARFFRLRITRWHGESPRLSELTLYSQEPIPAPRAPNSPYVLLVGNRHDGTGSEEMAALIAELNLGLQTLIIPYYLVSPELIAGLSRPPRAIILSGLGRDYETLPMFEFNGLLEVIRRGDYPLLGICGGHQLLAMAEGYTFVRRMGQGFYLETLADILMQAAEPITIIKPDPLLVGLPNPFYAAQLHRWEIAVTPTDYELLARSSCVEVIKHRSKPVYGTQFHGEKNTAFNVGRLFTLNFLRNIAAGE